uniref:TLR signaling inhibitor n=1 Tax=Parastrongyloides trichosuri TaxID=131310 RepID=A0A0N5A4F8_PARTI
MDKVIKNLTESELYDIAFEPHSYYYDSDDQDTNEGSEDCKNTKEIIAENFHRVYSIKTFRSVLSDLRRSTYIINTDIMECLEQIVENVTNSQYVKLVTNEKILPLCKYFSDILKKRMNPFLRFIMLIIIRYSLEYLSDEIENCFGTTDLEMTIIDQVRYVHLQIGIGYCNSDVEIKYATMCRLLALQILYERKLDILIFDEYANLDYITYIARSVKESTEQLIYVIIRKQNRTKEELEIVKIKLGNTFFYLSTIKRNVYFIFVIYENIGCIKDSGLYETISLLINDVNLVFQNAKLFDYDCDDYMNNYIRESFVELFEIFKHTYEILSRENEIDSYLIFLPRIRETIELYKNFDTNFFNNGEENDCNLLMERLQNVEDYFNKLDCTININEAY